MEAVLKIFEITYKASGAKRRVEANSYFEHDSFYWFMDDLGVVVHISKIEFIGSIELSED